jgi:hypothetical protein
MEPVYRLYYCNPHELVGSFRTLSDARASTDRDYCQYIVETLDGRNAVVWSTARENPRMMKGYSWCER